jgi:hypothetical protein
MAILRLKQHTHPTEMFQSYVFSETEATDWLNELTIVSIYDPDLSLLFNGSICGEQSNNNLHPVTHYRRVLGINLHRSNGSTRVLPFSTYTLGEFTFYLLDVTKSCSIGLTPAFLNEKEKLFYGSFIFIDQEPTESLMDSILKG